MVSPNRMYIWQTLKRWLKPPRRLRFTRFGTYVVLITLGIGLGAMNTGNNLVYLVFGMMLGFIAASGVLSEQSLRGLELDWIFPQGAFAGSPALMRLIVRNRKEKIPSMCLEVETMILTENLQAANAIRGKLLFIPPQSHSALDIPLIPSSRGRIRLGEIKIETKFPFGFFRKYMVRESLESFVVYPKIDLSLDLEVLESPMEKNRTTREKGWGDTFRQIRDFVDGDSPRQIAWKSTAKEARLMVRETEMETDKKITFVMEPKKLWADMSAPEIEDAVSFAASLVWKKFLEGYAVGFLAEDFRAAPSTNRKNLSLILEYLALFQPGPPQGVSTREVSAFPEESQRILSLWKSKRK